jgi:GAF domain-containing protein
MSDLRPESEPERLRSLRLHKILDTAAEKTFDDLTRLAANICGTPISLISLIDAERQWFKSSVGMSTTETPRDHAFCAHTILTDDVMIVEDALEDARFATNPLVTSTPSIRFYAGAPLIMSDGYAIGSLCVIDSVPGRLTSSQLEALRTLRDAVVTQLTLRRAQDELRSLTQLLPMCAWCRSIRDNDGRWQPLHEYLMDAVPVTHGACPACSDAMQRAADPLTG